MGLLYVHVVTAAQWLCLWHELNGDRSFGNGIMTALFGFGVVFTTLISALGTWATLLDSDDAQFTEQTE